MKNLQKTGQLKRIKCTYSVTAHNPLRLTFSSHCFFTEVVCKLFQSSHEFQYIRQKHFTG